MEMLDERNYLNKRPDYTAWNERAEESEERVISFAARDERERAREEMATWNGSPMEEAQEDAEPRTLRLVRKEKLRRLESGARTEKDFQMLVAEYDRIEANQQRSIRGNELPRGDLPWEYEIASLPTIFPEWMNQPLEKQMRKGSFLDVIFDCPYELRELVTNGFYSKQFDSLTPDQKFVAYFYFLRQWRTRRIATLKGSSPRAIRKIKSAVEANLQKPVYHYLLRRAERAALTNTERAFLAEYGRAMKQPGFKGGISRTLKRDKKKPAINGIKMQRKKPTLHREDVYNRGVWQLTPEADSESLVCVTI